MELSSSPKKNISDINKDQKIVDSELTMTLRELTKKYGKRAIENELEDIDNENKAYIEPILDPINRKFTAFPIKYQSIWEMYKKQMACMWKPEEIDFSNDYDDFQTLNKNEQHLIEMILAFFAASDGIVNFNLGERFIREIQITEAKFAYTFQEMMEDIHSHTYSLMLENLVRDPKRRQFLFNAIETIPSVKLMADWAFKWIESNKSFAHRVIAFAVVEGIFFSGAFAVIFWIKKHKNKTRDNAGGKCFMDGLTKSNFFIARDEGMHTDFACEIYALLENKLSQDEVISIVKEGVQIAQHFMTESLPVRLIGMNNEMMEDYIEYVADRLLVTLGYKKVYNKPITLKYMETIGFVNKQNLHEGRGTEYQDPNILNVSEKNKIAIDDDF